jgi:hypothetical protein
LQNTTCSLNKISSKREILIGNNKQRRKKKYIYASIGYKFHKNWYKKCILQNYYSTKAVKKLVNEKLPTIAEDNI